MKKKSATVLKIVGLVSKIRVLPYLIRLTSLCYFTYPPRGKWNSVKFLSTHKCMHPLNEVEAVPSGSYQEKERQSLSVWMGLSASELNRVSNKKCISTKDQTIVVTAWICSLIPYHYRLTHMLGAFIYTSVL